MILRNLSMDEDEKWLAIGISVSSDDVTQHYYFYETYTQHNNMWVKVFNKPYSKRLYYENNRLWAGDRWIYHSKNPALVEMIKWKLEVPKSIMTYFHMAQEENKMFEYKGLYTCNFEYIEANDKEITT
jgi:hypothetical protein